MSNNFNEMSVKLKNIMDSLPKSKEYEFHLSSTYGTDVNSRFGALENIQYHNDESLTVTCIDDKKKALQVLIIYLMKAFNLLLKKVKLLHLF